MSTSRADVNVNASLRLLQSESDPVQLDVWLQYSSADPYAVTVAFQGDDVTVNWVFARELLCDGLTRSAGLGDVQIWPSSGDDESAILIRLSSPDGLATLEADRSQVREFLDRTEEIVAQGSEADHLDIDQRLADLMEQFGEPS